MSDYVLSCCSTADLTREWLERRNISYVYFNYQLDGVPCKDDFGQTNAPHELYTKMLAGADAKTSMVSIGEYSEYFEPFLKEGRDVLHVTLSSGISATVDSARAAAAKLAEQYPGRTVRIVDSLCASSGYGFLMDKLADLRDEGLSLDELADWAEAHRLNVHHWFFSTDLTFFVRGGRVSKASGFFGGLLKICPVMTVERDGSLGVREKIRTKSKAISRDIEIMKERAKDGLDYAGKVFISQSDCLEDAQELARRVEETFPKMDGKVEIFPIGATIGVHTGPGTVALFYWGSERDEPAK